MSTEKTSVIPPVSFLFSPLYAKLYGEKKKKEEEEKKIFTRSNWASLKNRKNGGERLNPWNIKIE